MKFLWVNNVPSILGGTLNCTHSMCKALPDHDHTVISLQGKFRRPEHEAFAGVATLITERVDADVVIFQNSPMAFVGSFGNVRRKSRLVYYHHSAHGARDAHLLTDHQFYVSDYLKNKVGLPGVVLHQPVTRPKMLHPRKESPIVIGRLCTPTENKWIPDEFVPYFAAVAVVPNTAFEFVGCPEDIQSYVASSVNGRAIFRKVGFSSRGHLRSWHGMLYTASQHETFGRTVREAQRCGCVPIVSNHSGLAEQVVPGVSGFLVDSPKDAVDAVTAMAANPGLVETCTVFGDRHGSLATWAERFCAFVGV